METIHVGTENKDPDQLIREGWGENLQDHLNAYVHRATKERGLTRKQFRQLLIDEKKVDVSLQSIGMWLTGQTAPRPSMQIVIADVLGVPARSLFPLEKR